MSNLLWHTLKKSYASDCLALLKMKAFLPCEVEDENNDFSAKIVEIVFDPFKVKEVNARFRAAGFEVPERLNVIALNEDGSILLWNETAGIFYSRKGEPFDETWEGNSAFDDLLDLTGRFNIKNKKAEVDDMMAQLHAHYTTR